MARIAGMPVGLLLVVGLIGAFSSLQCGTSSHRLRLVRRMNRTGFVPRMMATAGEPGVATSIVRHLGRKTGGGYKTPLQAPTTADGFVIPLPYGITADWLENVRAVGSAVIIHGGDSYPVDQPESISLQDAMRSGSPPTHAGRSSLATTP